MCIAAAIAGAAVVGGVIQSDAAGDAADAQVQASNSSIAEQRRQYDLTRKDQEPWRQAGLGALNRLNTASTGDNRNFFAAPDYTFRRNEGMRGIQQSAAARGGAFSGNALKALSEFNSNLASGEYGNWWNRQAGLAGVGQEATNAVGQFGQRSADNISNSLMAQGDARASGIMGRANGITSAINSGIGNYYGYKNYENSLGW